MAHKIAGTLSVIDGNTFKFSADENLSLSTKYKLVIESNFRSEAGVLLGERKEYVFTTAISSKVTFGSEDITFGSEEIEFK